MEQDDEPCQLCGGSGVITVDGFTPSRGHFDYVEVCECVETDYDDREPEDLTPLERGAPYLD